MRRCPNCGQATARTEDWACQWCGYPLLSKSYKKIPKTYKQLKEERLGRQIEETGATPLPSYGTLLPTHTSEPEPEPMPEPELAPESEPTPTEIEVTVEELHSAYEADKVAADAKFTNKILKVTGVVDRIVVKDIHDIYYIILTSAEKKEEWNVRCTFDKEHGAKLNRLKAGQAVTVHGKYDGYRINILMRDCVLVR